MASSSRATRPVQSSTEDLRALLPGTLLRLLGDGRSGRAWGEWIDGSLMHCDVTGFTAMSEGLAGKEGAEIMTSVLNRFFERMLGIGSAYGGDQVKFGGDSMLLLFHGRDHATRAASCGLEMQAVMREFRRVAAGGGEHTLRMRAGIHSGRFYAASAGEPKGLWHFLLLGPDVNLAAEAEPAAAPGEVVVTAATARRLSDGSRVTMRKDGLARVLSVPEVARPRRVQGEAIPRHASRYVSSLTLEALGAERISGISGEHRRVTVLFVAMDGLSEMLASGRDEAALAQLDADLGHFLRILHQHGGYLSGTDVAEHYDKLIAVFGAPVSHERQEESALACALEFREAVRDSPLSYRIGANTGFVFAGTIGSPTRREFTVMGDAVNTGARLMSAARPGEIIASADTFSACSDRFGVVRMRPLHVKGKAEPVHAVRVRERLAGAGAVSATESPPMVGRQRELRSLVKLAERAAGGRGQWAYVWGEPGIGKSLLTSELARSLTDLGWNALAAEAQPHTSGTPYAPWLAPLRGLLSPHAGGSGDAKSILAALAPAHVAFAPLLLELLSMRADFDAVAGMGASVRRARLHETIVALLAGHAKTTPLLVLFEDVHWADESSLELLALVASRLNGRQLLCVTSREAAQPGALAAAVPALSLSVGRLDDESARNLAAAHGLGSASADAVIARGAGNPLFLRELARAGSEAGELPDNVHDLLIARADRLPVEERSVLRVASVVGPTFDRGVVASLVGDTLSRRRLDGVISSLTVRGFARSAGEGSYSFGHALMHEVVYGGLPFRERRRLHQAVVANYETRATAGAAIQADVILRHAEGAEDNARIVRYASLAGDRDVSVYALEAALERYQRARDALDKVPRASEIERSLILERVGDCEASLGRFVSATRHYEQAIDAGAESRARPRLVPISDAASRPAVLAQKVGYAMERNADYDGALPWFDRALSVLPSRRPRVGAQICAAKSGALYRKGNYEDAIAWAKRGLRYATTARSEREIAYTRNMLGNSHLALGRMKTAIRHYRHAVRIYHEIGDLSGQAKANNNLGMSYFWEGVLDGALYHYQVARRTDERIGDVTDAMIARNNVAEVLLLLGRTDEALDELKAVLEARAEFGGLEDVVGLVHVNLSRSYLAMGRVKEAWTTIRKAESQLRRIHADGLLVEVIQQKAEICLAEGETRKATAHARRALADARRLGLAVFEPACERVVGEALAASGRTADGTEHLKSAVALARRRAAAYEEARSTAALGRVLIESGQRSAGLRSLARARTMFSKMGAERPAAELGGSLERNAA